MVAFIAALIALLTTQWSLLWGSVIVLVVAFLLFAFLHGPIQKAELFDINQRHILIGRLASEGRWQEALRESSRSVSTLAKYRPDRPGSGEQALSLPLAVARLTHGLLEAANGRIDAAQLDISNAVTVFAAHVHRMPEVEELLHAGSAANDMLRDSAIPSRFKIETCRDLLVNL